MTLEQARANKVAIDWDAYTPPAPAKPGVHVFEDFDVATLRNYIDWTPFFMTWSLVGKYPAILEHEEVGEEAKRLFKDANDLLDRVEREGLMKASGICALYPAASIGDDIEVYTDESRTQVAKVLHNLRQQLRSQKALTTVCLTTSRRKRAVRKTGLVRLLSPEGLESVNWRMRTRRRVTITTPL